ncbi:MAG: hypothetical protein DMG24_09765 [Acidobacteria bacterium]|nr:MAG: hypothetical protein DMG24_09765 [Acidobacteriota bacterium]
MGQLPCLALPPTLETTTQEISVNDHASDAQTLSYQLGRGIGLIAGKSRRDGQNPEGKPEERGESDH